MIARRCVRCGGIFHPRPQVPDQSFCSGRNCQRARKQLWQQARLRDDPDYRENQRAAQRNWLARNPGYWREYRARRARQIGQEGVAKMDVSFVLPDVLYRIRKSAASGPKTGDLWVIEAVSADPTGPRKMDASREDLIDSPAAQQ